MGWGRGPRHERRLVLDKILREREWKVNESDHNRQNRSEVQLLDFTSVS